ncbi:MAG: hypothetical protein ABII19_03010 [Patescibacteria group bacterium]
MSRQSCPGLEVGEEVVLCRVEERWEVTVARIRFGRDALCLALQNFLLFLGHLLEVAGETSKIDQILAAVGRAKLPEGKEFGALEEQSLRTMEAKWSNVAREVRTGTMALFPACEEFLMYIGRYLTSRAEPKSSEKSWAEKQRDMMLDFYHSLKVGNVHIATELQIQVPSCTDDRLREWFAIGKSLIYEPSETEVPVAKLMTSLPHQMMADDPGKIVWEPVREGRWLLVDAQEHCPRAGERSFRGFNMVLERGQRIMTLQQYATLWHFGNTSGEILDLETDTLLATRYGSDSVMHAVGRCAVRDLRFSVGEWRHTMMKHPKMGVRLVEVVA